MITSTIHSVNEMVNPIVMVIPVIFQRTSQTLGFVGCLETCLTSQTLQIARSGEAEEAFG